MIQSMVPDALRGRVMAVYSMVFMGMAPFGALLAGSLAHHVGAPLTVGMGASICLLASGIFWRYLPSLRAEAQALLLPHTALETH